MEMKLKLGVLALLASSCITVRLGGATDPPVIHCLEVAPPARSAGTSDLTIRIRDLSCTSDYDRTDMVRVDASGVVTRSAVHRWSAPPATALTELIERDLLREDFFAAVFRRSMMAGEDLVLEGAVREFGAREDGGWTAVIDTDLTLFESPGGRVLLQTGLRLTAPMDSASYQSVAESMSLLAAEWSDSVRTMVRAAAICMPGRP
jgi:ABC-type uncharacterized transport system auxiliary subunit